MYTFENTLREKGFAAVCGIDEAGCGPLAGPVYAAAVILNPDDPIEGLNDSKKLTEKKREALYPQIKDRALAWAIASATAQEIDEINILQATYLAMERAMQQLSVKPDIAMIDGNRAKDFGLPVRTVIKGDSLSANIAAASVLAKVTRDDLMLEQAQNYPQYKFDVHKGYGTKAHYEALRNYDASPVHRKSFLKRQLE